MCIRVNPSAFTMNYLTLIGKLFAIFRSNQLRGDKAAYVACRTLCLQLQARNPGLHSDLGYTLPVPSDELYDPYL